VENECTSRIFGSFSIFLPKIIEIGGNLTKFCQKQICLVFFGTRCRKYRNGIVDFYPSPIQPSAIPSHRVRVTVSESTILKTNSTFLSALNTDKSLQSSELTRLLVTPDDRCQQRLSYSTWLLLRKHIVWIYV